MRCMACALLGVSVAILLLLGSSSQSGGLGTGLCPGARHGGTWWWASDTRPPLEVPSPPSQPSCLAGRHLHSISLGGILATHLPFSWWDAQTASPGDSSTSLSLPRATASVSTMFFPQPSTNSSVSQGPLLLPTLVHATPTSRAIF